MLQLLKPTPPEPMIHTKTSHCNEKPTHPNQRKPRCSNEDPAQPKINKQINIPLRSCFLKRRRDEWGGSCLARIALIHGDNISIKNPLILRTMQKAS